MEIQFAASVSLLELNNFLSGKKWQNTSGYSTGIEHCGATDAVNVLQPCWKIISFHFIVKEDPWGRGVR